MRSAFPGPFIATVPATPRQRMVQAAASGSGSIRWEDALEAYSGVCGTPPRRSVGALVTSSEKQLWSAPLLGGLSRSRP